MNRQQRRQIALRYTFAFGQGHLSTFLSTLSMAGLVLAIALLVTVLSVMNGFDKEMRERILALVPHITLYSHLPIDNWQQRAAQLAEQEDVVGVAPFTQFDALFMRGSDIETARAIGIDVASESQGLMLRSIEQSEYQAFAESEDGLILGAGIADKLGANTGDRLTLIVPSAAHSAALRGTRFHALTLVAILRTGTELDQSAAFLPLPLASELAGLGTAVSGLRVSTDDLFAAPTIAWALVDKLPPGFYSSNWMMTHGNLYSAIQLSRDLVSILLFSIIAVAAFNVVSSLVLVVFDKRGDIAILRTLGASPTDIAWIFVAQGGFIGAVGVVVGLSLGAVLSWSVPSLVAWLEALLGVQFLNTDVYPVAFVPVDVLLSDLLWVGAVSLAMCWLASVYPALRAAKLAPAMVLNQS